MATQDEKNLTKGWIPTAFTFWQLVAVVLCLLLIFSILWGRYGRVARPATVKVGGLSKLNANTIQNAMKTGKLREILEYLRR